MNLLFGAGAGALVSTLLGTQEGYRGRGTCPLFYSLPRLSLEFSAPPTPLQAEQVPPKRVCVGMISRLMGLLLVDSNILLVNIVQVSTGSEDTLFLLFFGLSQIGPPLHIRKLGHWKKKEAETAPAQSCSCFQNSSSKAGTVRPREHSCPSPSHDVRVELGVCFQSVHTLPYAQIFRVTAWSSAVLSFQ